MDKLLKLSLKHEEVIPPPVDNRSDHEKYDHESQAYAPFVIEYFASRFDNVWKEDHSCKGKTSYTINLPKFLSDDSRYRDIYLYLFTGHNPCTRPFYNKEDPSNSTVGCPGVPFSASGMPEWMYGTNCYFSETDWYFIAFFKNNDEENAVSRDATVILTQEHTNAKITLNIHQEA